MEGNKQKILDLWREMIGDPAYKESDLSDIWAVQLGVCTESLNLDWYQRIYRPLSRRGEVVSHPEHDWAAATLDGYDAGLPGPVEAKHCSGFEKLEVVVQRYMAQCHWQMLCTQSTKCALSVIQGARQPYIEIIDYDAVYAEELMSRAKNFMEHVWRMTEPVVLDAIEVKRVSALKDYNMIGSNQWAAAASEYLANKEAAKKFEGAEKAIRDLVPNDAASCTGYGITVLRDRAMRLRIKTGDENAKHAARCGI
jgi:hypothetical protein